LRCQSDLLSISGTSKLDKLQKEELNESREIEVEKGGNVEEQYGDKPNRNGSPGKMDGPPFNRLRGCVGYTVSVAFQSLLGFAVDILGLFWRQRFFVLFCF